MADKRVQAAEAVVQSMRTGERLASNRAAEQLAEDVVLDTGREQVKGKAAVLERISGEWPFTPIFKIGGWSEPVADGDTLKVSGTFPALGAAPAGMNLTFSFNGQDKVSHIQQENVMGGPPQQVDKIPDHIKGQINSALYNGTPMVVCYVDDEGQPQQSLRGSTVVFSDTQLGIWVRSADGGLPTQAQKGNNKVSLLYRDSKTRSTIVVQGRAHVSDDPDVRRRLYELTPEVEQLHDTERKGAALIIDVTRLQGGGPRGNYRMQRE
jgi:uncharacterized pyridoxamine 5'-phosphate oxidase family protein